MCRKTAFWAALTLVCLTQSQHTWQADVNCFNMPLCCSLLKALAAVYVTWCTVQSHGNIVCVLLFCKTNMTCIRLTSWCCFNWSIKPLMLRITSGKRCSFSPGHWILSRKLDVTVVCLSCSLLSRPVSLQCGSGVQRLQTVTLWLCMSSAGRCWVL